MEGEGFMTGEMWRPVLAPLGGARPHKMTSQGFKEVPFVAGRADHGDGPQSPPLPVGLHPEHHQRGALGRPDVSQVRKRPSRDGSERARKTNVSLSVSRQHGGVRGLVHPHGHHGQRALQVSGEHPASEEQVRAKDWG